MKKNSYKVIGVMSGTSLDGIDMALITFERKNHWNFQIEVAETVAYPENWKQKLSTAIDLPKAELEVLNFMYTRYLAEVISEFINENEITALDAVCSHGHTVKHEPENGYTLQIGNLQLLNQMVKETVVCNFRVQDVKLGGQGAPLVPIGDRLLFQQYKYCLNLGGFANISSERGNKRIAYDICAVNTVLNFYAEKLGYDFDRDGRIAASGNINRKLLKELEELSFYKKIPPKSLGIEWVNATILPLLKDYEEDIPGLLNSYIHHVSLQIAANLDNDPASEVLVTGGGSFNTFLVEQIRKETVCRIVLPSAELVNYKEALIFGLLGVLKMRGEVNVLSSVTGAKEDHSSGVIYQV